VHELSVEVENAGGNMDLYAIEGCSRHEAAGFFRGARVLRGKNNGESGDLYILKDKKDRERYVYIYEHNGGLYALCMDRREENDED